MKKLFFIFLFLSTTITFAQDYRDKIIKTNNDTIVCRITLINQSYIYYHINKSGDKSMSVWQKEINSIYLDSASKPKIEYENFKMVVHDNKYITFEKVITSNVKDTSVSPIGIYVSGGFGAGYVNYMSGIGYDLSVSYAHKSHMITVTGMGCATFDLAGAGDNSDYMGSSYLGVLFGEALRGKHGMLSISAGIAASGMNYNTLIQQNGLGGTYNTVSYYGISCPIEIKAFILAYNFIGIGIHYSLNLTPLYCPSGFTISLVLGQWNIVK